jgi:deoxyribose-phosphate aldolase
MPQPQTPIRCDDWRVVAAIIDHTLLKPETTAAQVELLCREAVFYGCASVFVHPAHLARAVSFLHGSPVLPGTPIGFPQGAVTTTVKCFEADEALRLGARELDMVLNVGALKTGDLTLVESEICALAELAHAGHAILKVILETPLLTTQEKQTACRICADAGADFVKTATGLVGGATVEDIALMKAAVGGRMRVKASGGIRTLAQLRALTMAGASRIGTSSSVAILTETGAPALAI